MLVRFFFGVVLSCFVLFPGWLDGFPSSLPVILYVRICVSARTPRPFLELRPLVQSYISKAKVFGSFSKTSVFSHHRKRNKRFWVLSSFFMGFPRGDNWGTLRIPREDWGTLGKIRAITTPPLRILLFFWRRHKQSGWRRTFKSIRRNLRDPGTCGRSTYRPLTYPPQK